MHQVPTIKNPLATIATPDAWFDMVHINIVGPLPLFYRFTYILICINWFTWWQEAIPFADITAETVGRALVGSWIGLYGILSTRSTDKGIQFDANLWNELMRLLGSKRIHTTAYHPSSNGLVERFHWQLKASLRAHANPSNKLHVCSINFFACQMHFDRCYWSQFLKHLITVKLIW